MRHGRIIIACFAVLAWIGWSAYRDISGQDKAANGARLHRDQVVLAELRRIDAETTARQPKTLGELREIIGVAGWCGRFKGQFPSWTATWHFRSEIPDGDSRAWPVGDEYGWGEAARAVVDSCDSAARVQTLTIGSVEMVRLPTR